MLHFKEKLSIIVCCISLKAFNVYMKHDGHKYCMLLLKTDKSDNWTRPGPRDTWMFVMNDRTIPKKTHFIFLFFIFM